MTVYLDHAASSPLREEARDAWIEASAVAGNASSVHGAGQRARRLLEDARERFAAVVGSDPIEVVFTSGGTESINLALKGLWWARAAPRGAIALPDGEHHATLDAVRWLHEAEGAEVRPAPVDRDARIDRAAFRAALHGTPAGGGTAEDSGAEAPAALATALVASNEAGTVQDAAALAQDAAEADVPLHLDAVAAFGHVEVDFRGWRGAASGAAGLVALSVSGHKIGAPVGTGALVVSRAARIAALQHGGGQQRALRAGTQDVAGAVALATAAELAEAEREGESARLSALRDRLVHEIRDAIPEAVLLGDPVRRLPGNVHLLLPGVAGESLLFLLDRSGISVSTGSACQAGVTEPSHVVMAMGWDAQAGRQAIRITMGRTTVPEDVDALVAALPGAYRRVARR